MHTTPRPSSTRRITRSATKHDVPDDHCKSSGTGSRGGLTEPGKSTMKHGIQQTSPQ
jgi:hypothetical protein